MKRASFLFLQYVIPSLLSCVSSLPPRSASGKVIRPVSTISVRPSVRPGLTQIAFQFIGERGRGRDREREREKRKILCGSVKEKKDRSLIKTSKKSLYYVADAVAPRTRKSNWT